MLAWVHATLDQPVGCEFLQVVLWCSQLATCPMRDLTHAAAFLGCLERILSFAGLDTGLTAT